MIIVTSSRQIRVSNRSLLSYLVKLQLTAALFPHLKSFLPWSVQRQAGSSHWKTSCLARNELFSLNSTSCTRRNSTNHRRQQCKLSTNNHTNKHHYPDSLYGTSGSAMRDQNNKHCLCVCMCVYMYICIHTEGTYWHCIVCVSAPCLSIHCHHLNRSSSNKLFFYRTLMGSCFEL